MSEHTYVYFLPNVFSNLLMRKNAQHFIVWVLEGGDWGSIVLRGKDVLTLLDYSDKNQNLAEPQNLALNMNILILYLRLNQSEWVSPLVHCQHKLGSVVDGGI